MDVWWESQNRISSEELNGRLSVESTTDIVRQGRLRWFGHLEQKGSDDWVSAYRSFEVAGPKNSDRSKKTWSECVKHDLHCPGVFGPQGRVGAGQE